MCPESSISEKSALVQVMNRHWTATTHYLTQGWPPPLMQICVTRPQWVNLLLYRRYSQPIYLVHVANVFDFSDDQIYSQHDSPLPTTYTWWRHQMETFSALLTLCAGNSPVPVNSPHKGQWRGALMFSFICVWINDWVNNREASDLRRHISHYDVTVLWMACQSQVL